MTPHDAILRAVEEREHGAAGRSPPLAGYFAQPAAPWAREKNLQTSIAAGESYSIPLLEGDAGTAQTIAVIRRLVDDGVKNPRVNRTAVEILRRVRPYNDTGEVKAIYSWVLQSIRFTKDPAGKELLRPADAILELRAGDCDEINAILLPSLLGTVGYRTRLVTIASNPAAPDAFTHVYCEVLLHGRWLPLDAARPRTRFGVAPPRWFRKREWDLDGNTYHDVAGLGDYSPTVPAPRAVPPGRFYPGLPYTGSAHLAPVSPTSLAQRRSGGRVAPSAIARTSRFEYRSRRRRVPYAYAGNAGLGFDWGSFGAIITSATQGAANIIAAGKSGIAPTSYASSPAATPAVSAPGMDQNTLLLVGAGLVAVLLLSRR